MRAYECVYTYCVCVHGYLCMCALVCADGCCIVLGVFTSVVDCAHILTNMENGKAERLSVWPLEADCLSLNPRFHH